MKLIKKNNQFFLVHESGMSHRLEGDLASSWERLMEEAQTNQEQLQNHGLGDERFGALLRSQKIRNELQLSMCKGVALALPIFLALFFGGWFITSGVKKNIEKLSDVLNPNSERALREEIGFKERLEKFRPYIHQVLKVWEEEKNKVIQEKQTR